MSGIQGSLMFDVAPIVNHITGTEKKCTKCGETDVRKFHKDKSKKGGLSLCCAECQRNRNKIYYKKVHTVQKKRIRNDEHYLSQRPAWDKVKTEQRRGNMLPKPCEICGEGKTHGHHDDYSKPLEVRWLCTKHHGEQHHKY
jgi:hypothetical protein